MWTVTLTGEHDLTTAGALQRTIDSLLTPDTQPLVYPKLVVVDLSVVEFIDSTTVNVILRADVTSRKDPDAQLVLAVRPGTPAARVIDMLALRLIMPIYATRFQAVADLTDLAETRGA